jgi:hypothetical protein
MLLQVDGVRRQRHAAFEQRDGLVELSDIRQLTGVLEKGRRECRPPRGGFAQLVERLVAAPRSGERRSEQGFDGWIIAAPRRPLQRRDRLAGTVLHQQGAAEYRRRDNVAPVGLQDIGGDPLRLIGPQHLQCEARALQRMVAGAWPGSNWRTL